MNSCLYHGTLRHRRLAPKAHHFTYSVFMAWLDLDELDALPSVGVRRNRVAPAAFYDADYPLGTPLKEHVLERLENLTGEGFNVIKAYDGYEALELLEKNEVNLMIVDVMMPGLDGIRTTLKVRETSSIPIIILSAKSEDTDKILGLNIGADDYITKPFNPLELVARVKSQLRRYTQLGNLNQQGSSQVYKCGGLMINDENKEVTVDGEPIKLTPIEYNILLLLVKNAGKVFSIDQIYEKIWNEDAIGADNTVAVHIRHIREKIEINPKEPRYLKVVWGVGYKIEKQ